MPDMLVLKRDRRSGDLQMLVEIDPSPCPAWQPPAMPTPNAHRDLQDVDACQGDDADVDWVVSCVESFVADMELYPLEVTRVRWDGLRQDLRDHVRCAR